MLNTDPRQSTRTNMPNAKPSFPPTLTPYADRQTLLSYTFFLLEIMTTKTKRTYQESSSFNPRQLLMLLPLNLFCLLSMQIICWQSHFSVLRKRLSATDCLNHRWLKVRQTLIQFILFLVRWSVSNTLKDES